MESANAAESASDAFFAQSRIVELKLELTEASANALRENPRAYVRAKLVENGQTEYVDIGVKLKGAAGSFRDLDDRPALTLHPGKFDKRQRFHAMEKFHLNNSVQDETYLCEALCSELCREARVPATRVAHARVWINDRDVGLYVFKEGFDAAFLKRHFGDANGNLYDGGFCTDIYEELEKDSGNEPEDRSDLAELKTACEIESLEDRAAALERVLDVEAFINFMALELMMGHWDGYTSNKNNYRVYFDAATKKARFLPHGMDQMFQDPDFPAMQYPGSMVGSAVMGIPAWRTRYVERVKSLLPLFSVERLTAKVDELDVRLKEYFAAQGEDAARQHAAMIAQLKDRLVARVGRLREQVEHPDGEPLRQITALEFNEQGIVELTEWYPHEPEDNRFEQSEVDGVRQFEIAVGEAGRCMGSWRHAVPLGRGRYRLEANMKTESVEAISDEKGSGAGLRISGANRENGIAGDSDLTEVSFEFEVSEELSEVVLVAELRATQGKVVFSGPLRLRKMD
jgi:spore coat protein H